MGRNTYATPDEWLSSPQAQEVAQLAVQAPNFVYMLTGALDNRTVFTRQGGMIRGIWSKFFGGINQIADKEGELCLTSKGDINTPLDVVVHAGTTASTGLPRSGTTSY